MTIIDTLLECEKIRIISGDKVLSDGGTDSDEDVEYRSTKRGLNYFYGSCEMKFEGILTAESISTEDDPFVISINPADKDSFISFLKIGGEIKEEADIYHHPPNLTQIISHKTISYQISYFYSF